MCCRLCLEKKKLRNSHIIPEFLYKPLYDELHRFHVISTAKQKKTGRLQKGLREKLLCGQCEQMLSIYENYGRRVLRGGTEIYAARGYKKCILSGLVYEQFKLFQLSLLWRFSVCSLDEFRNVRIGKHEERLRQMILAQDPGSADEYACMVVAPLGHPDIVEQLIVAPEIVRIDGVNCCRLLLGSLWWFFFVTGHMQELIEKDAILSESGVLPIILDTVHSTKFIRDFASDLHAKGTV